MRLACGDLVVGDGAGIPTEPHGAPGPRPPDTDVPEGSPELPGFPTWTVLIMIAWQTPADSPTTAQKVARCMEIVLDHTLFPFHGRFFNGFTDQSLKADVDLLASVVLP
jgi:hypothetical protein